MRRKTKYPGVTQIGPATYEIRVQIVLPDTKRVVSARRIVDARSTEEAAEALMRLREAIRSEPPLPPALRLAPRTTLGDYAKSWLERRLARGMKPSTTERVVQVLEQVILPQFGSTPVHQIRKNDVESWLLTVSRRRNPRGRVPAPMTVNGWLRVLKTLLRDAVSDLELPHDPTMRVKSLSALPVRVTDERPNSLTDEEVRRFLAAAAKESVEVYAMVVVGFLTGMRFGELSSLTWTDISEADGLILIRKSQWRGHVSTTKTGKTRSAALHPIILDALRAQRRALVEQNRPVLGASLVFPSANGGYHVPSYLDKPFRRILKAAKIEKHLSPHGMRRTHNNLMRQAQVDRIVLHATIGHSSDRMTEHYSHVGREEKLAAVNRLVEVVAPEKNSPSDSPDCRKDDPEPEDEKP
jgi:integrase